MHFRQKDAFLPDIENNFPGYSKTISFEGEFINDNHRYYAECPAVDDTNIRIGIDGWLRRADALKIYEMGYFSPGDILEFGTYQGLSTSILSQANHDSGLRKEIHTVEINEPLMKIAQENLQNRHLEDKVIFYRSSSSEALLDLLDRDRKFDFIFVDHSHEYEPVHEICENMEDLLNDGGYCLFHDYIHPDTFNRETQDFKVYHAVQDGLAKDIFEPLGIFGCTALFRKIPATTEVTAERLAADYKKMRHRFVAATIERNDLTVKNIRLTTEYEKLRRHYLAMTADRDARDAQVAQLTADIDEIGRHYEAITKERDHLIKERDYLDVRLGHMSADFEEFRTQHDEQIARMLSEIEEFRQHYLAMTADRDARDARIAEQAAQIGTMADKYDEVGRHYLAMKTERDYLDSRVAQLTVELDTLMHYRFMDTTIKINKFLERHNLKK